MKDVFIEQDFPKMDEIYYNVAYPYAERSEKFFFQQQQQQTKCRLKIKKKFYILNRYLGNGLITNSDKVDSKNKRRKFNPSFHRKYI